MRRCAEHPRAVVARWFMEESAAVECVLLTPPRI